MPYFIGIVGGSCAGKTWLADRLQHLLGTKISTRLSLDDFYVDRRHLSESQADSVNFDHPRSIDWKRFERTLRDFAAGKTVKTPRYDYSTHARRETEEPLAPAPIIITEGLWLFRRHGVRQLFHLRIFIKSELDLCARRRVERDIRERGRNAEQVLAQFRATVAPAYNRFVEPQKTQANLILMQPPNERTVEEIASRVKAELNLKNN